MQKIAMVITSALLLTLPAHGQTSSQFSILLICGCADGKVELAMNATGTSSLPAQCKVEKDYDESYFLDTDSCEVDYSVAFAAADHNCQVQAKSKTAKAIACRITIEKLYSSP